VNIGVTKCFRKVFGQTANLENGYFLKEETGALRTKRAQLLMSADMASFFFFSSL
jgi:hypothetical protein